MESGGGSSDSTLAFCGLQIEPNFAALFMYNEDGRLVFPLPRHSGSGPGLGLGSRCRGNGNRGPNLDLRILVAHNDSYSPDAVSLAPPQPRTLWKEHPLCAHCCCTMYMEHHYVGGRPQRQCSRFGSCSSAGQSINSWSGALRGSGAPLRKNTH